MSLNRAFEGRLLLSAPFGCAAATCLSAGVAVAIRTTHFQLLRPSMPNGKGGVMAVSDGYELAVALAGIAVALFLTARSYSRSRCQ